MHRSLAVLLCLAGSALAQRAPQKPIDSLKANIERLTNNVKADWGIHIKCLETGEELAINADKQMDTMSTIKIPLLIEAFRQIEAGKFKLDDRVILTEAMKRPGTGVIRSLDAGASLTIKDMLTLMIIVSDNTATDVLFDKVGGVDAVNKLMDSYGLKNTRATFPSEIWFKNLRAAAAPEQFHFEGKTPYGLSSARDMSVLLERIKKGEAVSKQASEMMMQMLRGQVYSSRLPKYVSGFRVPHKTGDFLPYIGNDVGVFESPRRNVVVSVFTAHHTGLGPVLEDTIARIAEQIANYFNYRE